MHEYEFRLVVQHDSSFLPLLQSLQFSPQRTAVYYVKPHFRFKDDTWETKRVESTHAVYHDGLWFRWIHSIETPYSRWSVSTCKTFLHNVGNYQDPHTLEMREFVRIDSHAQLYSFHDGENYKLVFEWEYGIFEKPVEISWSSDCLNEYKRIYDAMSRYSYPRYRPNEKIFRRPVTSVEELPEGEKYLYANKLDGVFGLVYSYADRVKEKWEGYRCAVREGASLGDGFVFAAEKMENGDVFLLDVYRVRGHEVASWCRRRVLLEFLPSLKLMDGYHVQTYFPDKSALPNISFKTDGVIAHDTELDTIFKQKLIHSIDVVYFKGYFHLPDGRIKYPRRDLEDGCVYEISTADGQVIRKRPDRFKGNTKEQLELILSHGWNGRPIIKNDSKRMKK